MGQPRILVFDSGLGGLSVFDAILHVLPEATYVYVSDHAYAPYGPRRPEDLNARIPAVIAHFAALTPDVIVIACNTASTTALAHIRASVKVPVVGVVPAIKPAAEMSRSGVIGLIATQATVAGPYVSELMASHAAGVTVIPCAAPDLVAAAEALEQGFAVPDARIATALAPLRAHPRYQDMGVAVLGCTHFSLLRAELARQLPEVALIDSGAAIARRVVQVLAPTQPARPQAPRQAFVGWTSPLPPALLVPFQKRGFSHITAYSL